MKRPGMLPAGSMLLIVLSALTWYCQPAGGALLWAMQSVPLLLTLRGQYRGERRSLQWLGFILLFIVFANIMLAFNPLPILRMLGITSLLLALAMFGLLLYRMQRNFSAPPAHKES